MAAIVEYEARARQVVVESSVTKHDASTVEMAETIPQTMRFYYKCSVLSCYI
jgi:hypothetical protein